MPLRPLDTNVAGTIEGVFSTLFLVLPVSEAVLMWGAAPVIGVPLVLLFNTIGLDPIVAAMPVPADDAGALAGVAHP